MRLDAGVCAVVGIYVGRDRLRMYGLPLLLLLLTVVDDGDDVDASVVSPISFD